MEIKINGRNITVNIDNVLSVRVISDRRSPYWELYKKKGELKPRSLLLFKRKREVYEEDVYKFMGDTTYTLSEIMRDYDDYVVKNGILYYKPCVRINYVGGTNSEYQFDNDELCQELYDKLQEALNSKNFNADNFIGNK